MDSAESQVKEMIIKRYGKVNRFCEIINMPWTTLDSILKRGFANSNITNVMKISNELGIDTESLASGVVLKAVKKNIETEESPQIIQYYNMLNDSGKHEATKRVEELTHITKYTSKEDIEHEKFTNINEALEYLQSQKLLAAFKTGSETANDSDILKIANLIYGPK